MKYYKLLKDLPAFKAGDIFVLKKDGLYLERSRVMAYHKQTLKKFPNILTDWFVIEEEEKGKFWSRLAGVWVAPANYVEEYKDEFTWNEAMAIEKKLNSGWRLPTINELNLIAIEFGGKDGDIDAELLSQTLPRQGSYGFYWSRTAYNSSYAYYLVFSSSNTSPRNYYDKNDAFAVRLVKDKIYIEKKKEKNGHAKESLNE